MPAEQEQAVVELVKEWMRQARSDLTVALMTENEQIAPEILAFHAQQAVEKSLKALLIRRQIEFPRTHIIGVLVNLCRENGFPIEEISEEAVTLSQYAVGTRYPGEAEPVSREAARRAAGLAQILFEWVEHQIPS